MLKKNYTGINIQFPISQEILSGKKTVETRTYQLPQKYLNTDILMIETPGKLGNFKSRIVALIRFTRCIAYSSKKDFYADNCRHKVTPESPWAWKDKPKFGWEVTVVKSFEKPISLSQRKGIVFTNNIELSI
jgi:hypothetical protein